jgi:hypothetical protein
VRRLRVFAAAVVFLSAVSFLAPHAGAQDKGPRETPSERLGSVAFQISCKPAAQANFDRGVSFLHSFWYDPAADMFTKVIASDPDCAMGYWGRAMTGFPQINGWPDDATVAAAERLGQHALAAEYYRTLLANCAGANGAARERLAHASQVVASQAAGGECVGVLGVLR